MSMSADTLRRIEIRFPLTFSALATIVLTGLIIWHYQETKSIKETLIFFVIGATAVGQITASFYTARVLGLSLTKEARDIARENAQDARQNSLHTFMLKQAALRFGERWNDPKMHPARDTLRSILKHRTKSEVELLQFIEANDTAVHHVMNFLEEIGTCCRQDVVESKIMRDQFDAVVISAWETLFPWIRKARQE